MVLVHESDPRFGAFDFRAAREKAPPDLQDVLDNHLAKATYAINYFVRLDGHRGSFTGARQLVGHKGGVFKRLFDRNLYFMAHRHTRYVPNVHARQTRLPRCKCEQRRRWRCRWYPTATEVVGHVELLGTVAVRAVFSSNPTKGTKLLHSISAPAFKGF